MVTRDQILSIVNHIVEIAHPEKVILFGSYAYGQPNDLSDLDLLVVVKESHEPQYKRAREIRRRLVGRMQVPKDILVYTSNEIQEWQAVPQAFITTAVTKGKVLYEKQA